MLSNFLNRIKLPFRKEKELYVSLRQIIGFYPRDIELYKTALLHKSIARRNDKGKPVNNERLEFLGDAILDAVVGDIVFQHFPGKREGFLTNTRSKLVQRETLGRLAKEMGINDLIVSASRNQSHNSYMGGNAFEALVGAIYLDRGYDACMRFMQKRILSQLINIDKVAYKEVNFKSKLLEWTQKNRVRMEFQLLQQKKDENGSPVFAYQVVIEGIKGASATGYSKKESQQTASKLTLEMLRKQPQFIDAVFAAKTDRTKMEEEPTMAVPSTEESQDFFVNPEPVGPAREAAQPLRESVQPVHEAKPLVREVVQPVSEAVLPVREAKQPVRESAQPVREPEPNQSSLSNQKQRRTDTKEQKLESDNRPMKQQQPSAPKQQSSAPQKQEEKAAEKEAPKAAKPAKKVKPRRSLQRNLQRSRNHRRKARQRPRNLLPMNRKRARILLSNRRKQLLKANRRRQRKNRSQSANPRQRLQRKSARKHRQMLHRLRCLSKTMSRTTSSTSAIFLPASSRVRRSSQLPKPLLSLPWRLNSSREILPPHGRMMKHLNEKNQCFIIFFVFFVTNQHFVCITYRNQTEIPI